MKQGIDHQVPKNPKYGNMPEAARPNPDQLLAELQSGQEQSARGKLRIYFGASAGVGKTYAILAAAKAARAAGIDAVIGLVETHAAPKPPPGRRPRTPPHPPDRIQGPHAAEFDLDAALARRPALILVDELAHSNVAVRATRSAGRTLEDLLARRHRRLDHRQRPASRQPERGRRQHHGHPRVGNRARCGVRCRQRSHPRRPARR